MSELECKRAKMEMSRDEELGHLSVMVTPGGVLVREYLKDLPADAEEHETYAEFTDNSWLVVWQVWAAFGMEFRRDCDAQYCDYGTAYPRGTRCCVGRVLHAVCSRRKRVDAPRESPPRRRRGGGRARRHGVGAVCAPREKARQARDLGRYHGPRVRGSDECTLAMMNQDFVTKHYELVRFVDPDMFPGHSRESLIEIVPDMLEPLINSKVTLLRYKGSYSLCQIQPTHLGNYHRHATMDVLSIGARMLELHFGPKRKNDEEHEKIQESHRGYQSPCDVHGPDPRGHEKRSKRTLKILLYVE